MGIRAFLRPLTYKILARDQDPDSFLDRITGIIHVGANTGQERELYASKGLPVLWVEPIPHVYEKLVSNLRASRKISAFQCFCGDEKAADQAAQQEVLISTMTISLEPWQLLNKSQATIAI